MDERDTRGDGPLPRPSSPPEPGVLAAALQAPLSAGVGGLTALLWLVGRWSPARLSGEFGKEEAPLEQPRAALALLLALLGLGLGLLRGPPVGREALRRPWVTLVGASGALLGWLLLSALWAPDRALAGLKALELAIVAVGSAGLALAVWRGDGHACRAGLIGAALLGLLLLVSASLMAEDSGRVAALGGGPNVFGRNMGVLTLLGLGLWRAGRGPAWLIVAGVGAVCVLLSGSRGALAASLSGVLALAVLGGRGLGARVAIPGAAALTACGALLVVPDLWEMVREVIERRFALTLDQGPLGAREFFFEQALELAGSAPLFGVGLAGFPALTGLVYPHNLFLEVLCEGGAVGLTLLAATGAAWAGLLWRLRPLDGTALGVWTVLLVSAQASGDLYDSRGLLLWGLAALGPGLARASAAPAAAELPVTSASALPAPS